MLTPPPTARYLSLQALIESVQQHARREGYALVKRRSKKGKEGEVRRVWICCDRGRVFESSVAPSERKRDTGTRRKKCQFKSIATLVDDEWRFEVEDPGHNHEGSGTPSAHPSHRRLNAESTATIAHLSESGAKPREIISTLRLQEPDIAIKADDIYNARKDIKRRQLHGRSSIQALMDELLAPDSPFVVRHLLDEEHRIHHLFFAHRRSLTLLRAHPEVLLLDCTYKTNKFHMPLLEIVGVTSMNSSFFIAFCFMRQEAEEDFRWVLHQIKELYHAEGLGHPSVLITD